MLNVLIMSTKLDLYEIPPTVDPGGGVGEGEGEGADVAFVKAEGC